MCSEYSTPPISIQEVLDLVIDHLHEDKSSLASCALVARSWLPSSHLHLFSTLQVTVDGVPRVPSHDFTPFVHFLQNDASFRVQSSIRHLILRALPASWNYPRLSADELDSIVSWLPHLYSLEISQVVFSGPRKPDIPRISASYLRKISLFYVCLSVLVQISFWDIFRPFPELSHIELSGLTGVTEHLSSQVDVTRDIKLHPTHITAGYG